jgi:bla regulator protein blaR1
MLSWILYAICISGVLSLSALAAEYRSRLVQGRSRWIWIAVLLTSVFLPIAMSSVSVRLPPVPEAASHQTAKTVALREMTSMRLSTIDMVGTTARAFPWSMPDSSVTGLWVVLSATLLAGLSASAALLFWQKRNWSRRVVASTQVLVADSAGPAVVGLFRPEIVLPQWVADAQIPLQQAVIAHERSHLDACDPQVLMLALGLLVLMPWNIPLWWQVARLRRAIEIDCDTRVINGGLDAASYGEALVTVGEYQSGYVGIAAGMLGSRAFLEERIKIMVSEPKSWPLAAILLTAITFAMLAVAADISPPEVNGTPHQHKWVQLPEAQLEKYVGIYEFNQNEVLSVTRKDDQLYAGYQGQDANPIYPETKTDFFYHSEADSSGFSFVLDPSGKTAFIVSHETSVDRESRGARIDVEKATQLSEAISAKVRTQSATPGTEEAIKRVVSSSMQGAPNYAEMTPALANSLKKHVEPLFQAYKGLGAVQSITFRGVGQQGWDIYLVAFDKGVMEYSIAVADGVITNLWIHTAY